MRCVYFPRALVRFGLINQVLCSVYLTKQSTTAHAARLPSAPNKLPRSKIVVVLCAFGRGLESYFEKGGLRVQGSVAGRSRADKGPVEREAHSPSSSLHLREPSGANWMGGGPEGGAAAGGPLPGGGGRPAAPAPGGGGSRPCMPCPGGGGRPGAPGGGNPPGGRPGGMPLGGKPWGGMPWGGIGGIPWGGNPPGAPLGGTPLGGAPPGG